ncbi:MULTISPECIES: hypothetical protein [Aliivibrio]|uniref:Exported protein n=1 Tax=Aliivibrio salmonicida (strain LFI1238) TaxID=316275 RepID=B6EL84_ALISL|nr:MULTISPECIES: hypothetical protein [Aliivibrio]MBB1315001.1 hypothetical protein [Aliivibrio sp. SR45-2]CAQ79184.1 putative exported protein [Aliivibrio salmonicida LFI1238]
MFWLTMTSIRVITFFSFSALGGKLKLSLASLACYVDDVLELFKLSKHKD